MKKILHITNWYPYGGSKGGNFINRHFKCAEQISLSEIVHVQVLSGKFKFVHQLDKNSSEKRLLLFVPIRYNRIKEFLTTSLLLYLFFRLKLQNKSYDLYVFHIAYPLLMHAKLIKKILKKPIAIQEHWSAYSQNFYLPPDSPAKQRIANIFRHNIPLITVSEPLRDDIIKFAENDKFDKYIIPNIVFDDVLYPKNHVKKEDITFFMLANWSSQHKRLMLGVEAFCNACQKYNNLRLRIGGIGKQLEKAEKFLSKYPEIYSKVTFLGEIDYEEVGNEMRNADAFLHPSNMETFSLVCAEALFCNTPVIASAIPAIATFVNEKNGLLIENSIEEWTKALLYFIEHQKRFLNKNIGEDARDRFGPRAVADNMQKTFDAIIEKWSKNDK